METTHMILTVSVNQEPGDSKTKDQNILFTKGCSDCSVDRDSSRKPNRKGCYRSRRCTVLGVFLITLSILGFIYPLSDLLLMDKLNMRPGFPPFEWWSNPPDSTKVKVYIFNVTNHDRFLAGIDHKINVEEIGPIEYFERVNYSNIRFTENSTLTYRAKRYLLLDQTETRYDMNETIIVPNTALLGIASKLSSPSEYYSRLPINLLFKIYPNNFFIKTTIYEFLWNQNDSILDAIHRYAPGKVPVANLGVLNRTYALLDNEVTVKIGQRWGHKEFFKVYNYKGMPQLSGQDRNICLDKSTNVSEGILYPQYLTKDDVLLFLCKATCRVIPLFFDEVRYLDGLKLYRYNFSDTAFDLQPDIEDCHNDDSSLPSGLKDTSKCYDGFPMILSQPHFYGMSVPTETYVTGLKPDKDKHKIGYFNIEPMTGVPVQLTIKLQCSLRIRDIAGLYTHKFNKFSNLIIPLMWFEVVQDTLPSYIMNFLYFNVVILPMLSPAIFTCTLVLGVVIIFKIIAAKERDSPRNVFWRRVMPESLNGKDCGEETADTGLES